MKRLFLIDAYALVFKYYYAFMGRPMRNRHGMNTSILFGFTKFLRDIQKRGKEASPKEIASIPSLQLANECMARGIRFLPIDIEKSHSYAFKPENGAIRMPFSSLPGLGENAAQNIIKAREEEPFFSVEDLQIRAKLSKTVIEILRRNHVLDELTETDQFTFF